MDDQRSTPRSKRQYPPLHQQLVRVSLGIIVAIMVITLLIVMCVALGTLWPGG